MAFIIQIRDIRFPASFDTRRYKIHIYSGILKDNSSATALIHQLLISSNEQSVIHIV